MGLSDIPVQLPLEEAVLREIIEQAKDWGLMHGMGVRPYSSFSQNNLYIGPHALFPSPVPKKHFDELVKLQPAINKLMHRVAHNHAFLEETLKTTIQCDEFTRNLYKIYETVRTEGFSQDVSLGLFRSDYIHDSLRSLYQQVECNTIASSFAALTGFVSKLQSYVLRELGLNHLLENLPENNASYLMSLGIVKAWEHYGNEKAVVIFVVEDTTSNICDQRLLEYEIARIQPKIRVVRVKFSESSNFQLGPNKELLAKGLEVGVVYYRTGYDPKQYVNDEWSTRLLIERSKAIKCPSIQVQLAGTKKVQQALARPNVVEKFADNLEEANAVRNLFTELYSLDMDEEGDKAYNLALQLPENYVLKPQREGGGNNVYGADIPSFLTSLGKEREAYILMGRITPKPTRNYIVTYLSDDLPSPSSVVSELGIFGVILGSSKDIIANYQAGHLLRSKLSTSNEGGIIVGSGLLDSPYLV